MRPIIQTPSIQDFDNNKPITKDILTRCFQDAQLRGSEVVSGEFFHSLLNQITDSLPNGTSMKVLAEWKRSQTSLEKKEKLLEIFSYIPPEIIALSFDKDLLLYLRLNYEYGMVESKAQTKLLGSLEPVLQDSYDLHLLKKALNINKKFNSGSTEFDIKSNYELLTLFKELEGESIHDRDLLSIAPNIITSNLTSQGLEAKGEKYRQFSVEPKILVEQENPNSSHGVDDKFYDVHFPYKNQSRNYVIYNPYVVAPATLYLFYKDSEGNKHLSAFASAYTYGDTLLVINIQGAKGELFNPFGEPILRESDKQKYVGAKGLNMIYWDSILVEFFEIIARRNNSNFVSILSADNALQSDWNQNDTVKLEVSKAQKIYDGTAKRLGYTKEEGKNWIKKL